MNKQMNEPQFPTLKTRWLDHTILTMPNTLNVCCTLHTSLGAVGSTVAGLFYIFSALIRSKTFSGLKYPI